jgi:hypothetical protein
MGGGEATSTQTQKKVFPAQAAPVFGREFSNLTNTMNPLQMALLQAYTQGIGGQQGAPLSAPTQAGMLAGPAAGGSSAPTNLPFLAPELAYQANRPYEMAQSLQGIMPQQYAGFFAPDTETTGTSEGPDQTGQMAMSAAATAAAVGGTIAMIA